MGSAAAFGAGQVGAYFIINGATTSQGKRDINDTGTDLSRSWNWPAIHDSPSDLHDLLASGLPGPVSGYVYNHSDSNLDNSVTVFVESGNTIYAHSSNVTHGAIASVASMPTSSNSSSNSTVGKRDYRWDFQGLAGMLSPRDFLRLLD
jgi:hypothetical protein